MIDRPVAENAVEKAGGIEIAEKIPTEEEYGIVVAQGDEELLEEINEGLEEIIDDGTYTKIYEKWFTTRRRRRSSRPRTKRTEPGRPNREEAN